MSNEYPSTVAFIFVPMSYELTRSKSCYFTSPSFIFFSLKIAWVRCNILDPRGWQEEQGMWKKSVIQLNGLFRSLHIARIMTEMGYLNTSRFTVGLYARKNSCFMWLSIIIYIIRLLTCTSYGWKCPRSNG